jgi:hypothetical protein
VVSDGRRIHGELADVHALRSPEAAADQIVAATAVDNPQTD